MIEKIDETHPSDGVGMIEIEYKLLSGHVVSLRLPVSRESAMLLKQLSDLKTIPSTGGFPVIMTATEERLINELRKIAT